MTCFAGMFFLLAAPSQSSPPTPCPAEVSCYSRARPHHQVFLLPVSCLFRMLPEWERMLRCRHRGLLRGNTVTVADTHSVRYHLGPDSDLACLILPSGEVRILVETRHYIDSWERGWLLLSRLGWSDGTKAPKPGTQAITYDLAIQSLPIIPVR